MIKRELDIKIVKQVVDDIFGKPVVIERVPEGLSTYVYRLSFNSATYYMRILPEDASFAVEVKLHQLLIRQGLLVPGVIYFEDRNELLGLSLMIITEIPGNSVRDVLPPHDLKDILFQAGKQIAVINEITVDGFGWINRKSSNLFKGEKSTFHDYYFEYLYGDLTKLAHYPFRNSDISRIQSLLEQAFSLLDCKTAHLVHGDFDVSHIYHNKGTFTGFIDLGEIRGNSRFYDLAIYRLFDDLPDGTGYQYLLKGYNEIQSLPVDAQYRIDLLTLFAGVRLLGEKVGNQWFYNNFFQRVRNHYEMILREY